MKNLPYWGLMNKKLRFSDKAIDSESWLATVVGQADDPH